MMKRYNLKYCCDDVSVFPSSTLINHDNNKFSEYFGLTAISTYQLKNKEPNEEPKKKGKIYLFGLNQNIKDDDNNNCEIDYYLEYKKNINFHNGVLQSNYIFTNDKLYLGSVCVNGFYLSDLKEETYEKLLETSKEKNNSGLSFEAFDNKPEKICISFSNGDMCLLVHGQQEKTWYDNNIRIFDLRNIREPIQTVDVNSNIWRIKFLYKNNSVDNLLVAACDGGAKIFKKSNNGKLNI
ncbi:WD domain-containing protein [Plasmodium falciparum IGH-CR14]|uniref:WD domain-containing protein n=1 Tax=Plasmodium falciparum IGH-CR14 TaxID=580059 RepID=A0A0L1IC89_PLAFA|nr:WD domain-containing protein [Plasmodium falciparum IGH-CR14]